MPTWKLMYDPKDFPDFDRHGDNNGFAYEYSKAEIKEIQKKVLSDTMIQMREFYKENWTFSEFLLEVELRVYEGLDGYDGDCRYNQTYPMGIKRGTLRYHLLKDMKEQREMRSEKRGP